MVLSEKQLNSIAQDLDMGMICYIHKETKDVIVLPDPDSYDVEMELWQESIDKFKEKKQIAWTRTSIELLLDKEE